MSRTPPPALGWPVREKGEAPGRPICPVSRCSAIIIRLAATPCVCWLSPIVQKLITAWEMPQSRAASRISAEDRPHRSATFSGA